jgi:hypothetical protein
MVIRATRQLLKPRTEPLRSSTLTAINTVRRTDTKFEITLLSYFFAKSLHNSAQLSTQQYTLLGAANVWGWIAYTIYDDFLDNEGVPARLPIANVAMRLSLACFEDALPYQLDFRQYVTKIFNEMDEANAWEVAHCRFKVHAGTITIRQLPKYGNRTVLATRSFAHALGPMAVLTQCPKNTHEKTHHIESAFRHYLIAKQLNDDIHDWLDDIRTGQASYVVTAILRELRIPPGTYNLSLLTAAMQKRFRLTTMPRLCNLALSHINRARREFVENGLTQDTNNICAILDTLEQSFQYSLDQHAKAYALTKMETRANSKV